ncbi:YegS/Rv2252/BmrU family lipid kinase [soil metagenome]
MAEEFKILFVVNPASGTSSKNNWEATIREFFKPFQHKIEFFLLTGKNDAESLAYWIEQITPDRVVAVGGDGTVSLVAEQLLGKDMAIGILPAGSANGMAKELDISTNMKDALHTILEGEVRHSDVIRINKNQICLHLSDLGLNAQLVKYFEKGNLRGKLGYAKLIFKVLLNKKLMHVNIVADGKEIMRKAFMVVIANASKYGTGALINPTGNIHDGKFEIVIVRKIAFGEVLKMFLHFKRFNPKKVEVFHATTAQINTRNNTDFQVDGEYLGKVKSVEAEIIAGKLKVLLPKDHANNNKKP